MSEYETYIQGDRVMFRIGVQSFAIDYEPKDEKEISKEEALEWMRHLLDKALWNLSKDDGGAEHCPNCGKVLAHDMGISQAESEMRRKAFKRFLLDKANWGNGEQG